MKKCYFIIGWFFLAACSSSTEKKGHIEINRMKVVMWDMLKAGEWHQQKTMRDSMLLKVKEDVRMYAQVFSIHGITYKEFYDSYKYYEAHPSEFKILVDSIEAFANREKNAPLDTLKKAAP